MISPTAKALINTFLTVVFAVPEKLMATVFEQRAAQTPIDRPIFIIGPDRSGTSLVYSLLANHPDIFAMTAAASMAPRHPFSASLARRILSRSPAEGYRSVPNTNAKIEGGLLVPREAIHYWAWHTDRRIARGLDARDSVFTEEDLDETTRQVLPLDLKKRLFILQKKRFLAKNTGFSLKIEYLNALFSDAIFVHCIRNPVDNLVSILKQKELTGNPEWGVAIPNALRLPDASVAAQTARQLAVTYELILQSIQRIDCGRRYLPVRYEAFHNDFAQQARRLFQHCGLKTPDAIVQHPDRYFISNKNRKTPPQAIDDPQARLILSKLAIDMGYSSKAVPAAT